MLRNVYARNHHDLSAALQMTEIWRKRNFNPLQPGTMQEDWAIIKLSQIGKIDVLLLSGIKDGVKIQNLK